MRDSPCELVRLRRGNGDPSETQGVGVELGGGLECPAWDGEVDVCDFGDV